MNDNLAPREPRQSQKFGHVVTNVVRVLNLLLIWRLHAQEADPQQEFDCLPAFVSTNTRTSGLPPSRLPIAGAISDLTKMMIDRTFTG